MAESNNDITDFLNSMLRDDDDYEDQFNTNTWTKAASDGFGSPLLNVAMNTILQPEYSNLYAYSSIAHQGSSSAPVMHSGYDDWQLPLAAQQVVPFQLQDVQPRPHQDYFVSVNPAGTPPIVDLNPLKRPRAEEEQEVGDVYSATVAMSDKMQVQIGFHNDLDTSNQKTLELFLSSAQQVIGNLDPQQETMPLCVQTSVAEFNQGAHMSGITVMTPAIGQKSYGKEKRFFCPPPMARFSGPDYTDEGGYKRAKYGGTYANDFPQLSMCPDPSGYLTATDTGGLPSTMVPADAQSPCLAAIFRGMHMGDLGSLRSELAQVPVSDPLLAQCWTSSQDTVNRLLKRDFNMYMRVSKQTENKHEPPQHVGTFESDNVCLISKPSKKKSSKQILPRRPSVVSSGAQPFSSDVIENGSCVTLYNRVKNQNVSTRCLALERNAGDHALVGKNVVWHPFTIVSVQNQDTICDGSYVYLKSKDPIWRSEQFRIRIVVDRNTISNQVGDPLSHLQRVCLEYVAEPGKFLQVDTRSTDLTKGHLKGVTADESLVWSIVGVAQKDYVWYQPPSVQLPITPVPEVVAALLQKNAAKVVLAMDLHLPVYQWLELLDRVKNADTTMLQAISQLGYAVYVGDAQLLLLHSECFLTMSDGKHVPAAQALTQQQGSSAQAVKIRTILQVPAIEVDKESAVFLVRKMDGVVYPLGFSLKFSTK